MSRAAVLRYCLFNKRMTFNGVLRASVKQTGKTLTEGQALNEDVNQTSVKVHICASREKLAVLTYSTNDHEINRFGLPSSFVRQSRTDSAKSYEYPGPLAHMTFVTHAAYGNKDALRTRHSKRHVIERSLSFLFTTR